MKAVPTLLSLLTLFAGPVLGQCTITLSASSSQVSDVASTGSFAVSVSETTCPWSAGSNASWLTITFGQSGSHNGSVGYKVDANTTYASRTGVISVNGQTFTVTQAGLPCPSVSFTPGSQLVQPSGGSFSISITSPCGWNAGSDAAWITLSAGSGTGSGSLSYSVAADNTGASRSGNILINNEEFTVTQLSIVCNFTISPLSINVAALGGQEQISVQTSNSACPWGVTNGATWISNLTIGGSPAVSSTGNGTIAFSVAANLSLQPRMATLAVADQVVAINQAGDVCGFTLNPASAQVPSAASMGTFSVTPSASTCTWTAVSNNNWIALTSGQSGTGDGSVAYSIAANTSVSPLSGSITVGTSMFNVTQAACSGTATFSPPSQSVQSAGGNFSVGITTPCTWTASTTASWIALNAGSGTTGNGSLSYTVAPNNTASSRAGTIQVNSQAFTVTQSGISSAGSSILFTAQSVVNGASFLSGPIAPGELFTIFGSGLGPAQAVPLQTTSNGQYVTTLAGGTEVLVNGIAAPLTYVSGTQVNAIVPFETTGAANAEVVVQVQGNPSTAVTLPVAASSPAVFAVSGGKGQGAVLNQDNSPNSASNPAAVGSVLQVFATGFGQTLPAGTDGQIAGSSPANPVATVTATIGGIAAPVQYAGSSNGLVAGVTQVNVTVPAGVQPGNAVPLVITVGGTQSASGITVALH